MTTKKYTSFSNTPLMANSTKYSKTKEGSMKKNQPK